MKLLERLKANFKSHPYDPDPNVIHLTCPHIPCDYCGTLNITNTSTKCLKCGAPLDFSKARTSIRTKGKTV